MSEQPTLPHIECPVKGVHKGYTMTIAASKDSTELKYRIRGVWRLAKDETPITVLGLLISSECPTHVYVLYVVDGGDGILQTTYGNDVVPIGESVGLSASIRMSEAEDEQMDVLHHGSSLYIKAPNRKTYTYMAVDTSKVIRGNAYYKLISACRESDNLIHFVVSNVRTPEYQFVITAKSLMPGKWHRVPGKLCPVEGPDPDEE